MEEIPQERENTRREIAYARIQAVPRLNATSVNRINDPARNDINSAQVSVATISTSLVIVCINTKPE